jgi:hypothetical protein
VLVAVRCGVVAAAVRYGVVVAVVRYGVVMSAVRYGVVMVAVRYGVVMAVVRYGVVVAAVRYGVVRYGVQHGPSTGCAEVRTQDPYPVFVSFQASYFPAITTQFNPLLISSTQQQNIWNQRGI